MNFSSRAAAVLAALSIAVVAPLSGAQASSGLNWKTKVVVVGAKLQLCKAETTKAGPWKVHVRVDASNAAGPVSGLATITKNDNDTKSKWTTKGMVKPGTVTAAGTVKLPQDTKSSTYAVTAGMGTTAMGDGGSFVAKQIPHC
jgi:hypothetical protein